MRRLAFVLGFVILFSLGTMLLFISAPAEPKRDRLRQPATQAQPSPIEPTRIAPDASCSYPDGRILIIGNRLEPIGVVKPKYPENAKLLHIEGLVQVTTLVDQNGDVVWACGRGHPELISAAEEAALASKFPKRGIPGLTPVVLNFDFRLNEHQGARVQEFVWKTGGKVIGRLNVPADFQAEPYEYREGIVTTLRYRDGARILLQAGGMFRIPLFKGPEYELILLSDLGSKTVRSGRAAEVDLYWREDNYKRRGTWARISMALPPNLGYSEVPAARRSEFDRALDSFALHPTDKSHPPRTALPR